MMRMGIAVIAAVGVVCHGTAVVWGQEEDVSGSPIINGFLIVEGRAIDIPYVFRSQEDALFVNDIPVNAADLEFSIEDDRSRRRQSHRRVPWRKVAEELEGGAIVVVLENERPVSVGVGGSNLELLRVLSDESARREAVTGSLDWLKSDIDEDRWRAWLSSFQPSEEFRARAQAEADLIGATEQAHTATVSASRRLEASAYPLTTLGMVLLVLATGHLLSYRPDVHSAGAGMVEFSPELNRLVCRSLLFVFLLSGLDLTWTLLISQTGAMRELNPLGSRLIQHPEQLILFKLGATSLAVVLLFATRRSPLAQRASWWMCLVCTMLTARWLMFNSMHVT